VGEDEAEGVEAHRCAAPPQGGAGGEEGEAGEKDPQGY